MVGANGVGHNACAARQVWCREAAVLCVRSGGGAVAGQPTGVRSALVCGDDRFESSVHFCNSFSVSVAAGAFVTVLSRCKPYQPPKP